MNHVFWVCCVSELNCTGAYKCDRSFKDLSKALNSSLPNISLPLPDDLLQVLHAYLEKHADYDESNAQRLQDELLSLYDTYIREKPTLLGPFLAILRTLRLAIRGSGRLLQWWDKLAITVLSNIGEEKGLALEAKSTLLSILVYDEDDEIVKKDAVQTSETVSHNLMEVWLKKHHQGNTDFDNEARFVEGQIKLILLAFGRKRPKVGTYNEALDTD
jgi:solute carrier family 25 protein 16